MLIALLLAAAPVPACPWERAHYEMVGEPQSTITTSPLPPQRGEGITDLALRIRDGRTGRVRWFFGEDGTTSVEHLISINDPTAPGWLPPDPDSRRGRPYGDLIVMAYGPDLRRAEAIASTRDTAPAYLVVPEIADAFREGPDRPSNTVYRLSACAPR